MIKKRWIALIALLSLSIGAGGASWYWLTFNARLNTAELIAHTQANITTRIALLEHIQSGRIPEATKLLETLLDGDLINAGALAHSGIRFNSNTDRAVALEFQARTASGYRPEDDRVNDAVREAFDLMSASATDHSQP